MITFSFAYWQFEILKPLEKISQILQITLFFYILLQGYQADCFHVKFARKTCQMINNEARPLSSEDSVLKEHLIFKETYHHNILRANL